MTADSANAPRDRAASDALIHNGGGRIDRLLEIMARLRDPIDGCPWDQDQTSASIARYAIEEAYELVDAINDGDPEDIRDELGDVLLQVVFHAQMRAEADEFDFADVVRAISDKMVRRHPHVLPPPGADSVDSTADSTAATADSTAVRAQWETIKAAERAAKAARRPVARPSVLDGVAKAQPALSRAQALKRRAARVGFDWPDAAAVMDKVIEETQEFAAEQTAATPDPARLQDEFGDVLFTLCILGAHLGVDAEAAARGACDKFERRFRHMEAALDLDPAGPSRSDVELDAGWRAAKAAARRSGV